MGLLNKLDDGSSTELKLKSIWVGPTRKLMLSDKSPCPVLMIQALSSGFGSRAAPNIRLPSDIFAAVETLRPLKASAAIGTERRWYSLTDIRRGKRRASPRYDSLRSNLEFGERGSGVFINLLIV